MLYIKFDEKLIIDTETGVVIGIDDYPESETYCQIIDLEYLTIPQAMIEASKYDREIDVDEAHALFNIWQKGFITQEVEKLDKLKTRLLSYVK